MTDVNDLRSILDRCQKRPTRKPGQVALTDWFSEDEIDKVLELFELAKPKIDQYLDDKNKIKNPQNLLTTTTK